MTRRRTKPWKQSIRHLPPEVVARARRLGGTIQVGVVIAIRPEQIRSGTFSHLGLALVDDRDFAAPPDVLPPPETGPASRRNVEGWEQIHRGQPKEPYSWDVESPNWGDWGRGSHTTSFSGMRYPRTFHPPRYARIQIQLLAIEADGRFNVHFTIGEPLDSTAPQLESDLFELANLLQENVGGFDVQRTGTTRDEWLGTIHVEWRILPPGQREDVIVILTGIGAPDPAVRERIESRMDELGRLGPTGWVVGTEGFQRYFGARMAEDIYVFENLQYGNALYVMGGDWAITSRRSRTDLLSDRAADYTRIVHRAGWERRLANEVEGRRNRD